MSSGMSAIDSTPEIPDEMLEFLRSPIDLLPLERVGDSALGIGERRFEVEQGILRTLGDADPLLAAELRAQELAVADYLDPRLLMPRYERDFVVRLVMRFLKDSVDLSGVRVLDAGCGVGLIGRLHSELNLVGLDASFPLLKQATTGYRARVEASAEAMPFAAESFDVVLAINMLHHVINPENAVREFARVLRPGGTLICVDPRKVAPIEFAKRVLRSNEETFAETHKAFGVGEYSELVSSGSLFRVERFERKGLAGLVGMAGLDALKLSYYLPTGFVVDQLIRVDDLIHRLPVVPRACLNLAVCARRTEAEVA